jgi:ankyrin repeat protein
VRKPVGRDQLHPFRFLCCDNAPETACAVARSRLIYSFMRYRYKLNLRSAAFARSPRRSSQADEVGLTPRLDINNSRFSPKDYLQSGRDVNIVSRNGLATPLELAIDSEDWRVVRKMLEAGAAPRNRPPLRPVGVGAYMNDVPFNILKLLVDKGVQVEMPNAAGFRPLQLAVSGSDVKVVRNLLKLGANPNARDRLGRTSLHEWASTSVSSWQGRRERAMHVQKLRLLLRAGVNINAKDREGCTPLQIALGGYMDRVAYSSECHRWDEDSFAYWAVLLLRNGARPTGGIPRRRNARSTGIPDRAPMLMAWPVGPGLLHRELLRAGASPNEEATNGLTPLTFIERRLATIARSKQQTPSKPESPDILREIAQAMRDAQPGPTSSRAPGSARGQARGRRKRQP